MTTTPPISRTKRLAFTGVMLLLPVLFFLLLEGGLRLFGYGADTRLLVEREVHGRAYYAVNPDVVRRYFGREGFAMYTSRDLFAKEKQPGTYRIFALGASTTVGFPYLFNASYSSILRTQLEAKFPDRHFEVVNLGITAVNSFTVADLVTEVVRYEPDLLIVYSGHNEFYGALGVASAEGVGRSYGMIRFRMRLRNLKTAELVGNLIGGAMRMGAPSPGEAGETLMEQMAREHEIARGSDLYRLAVKHYERNLDRIARTASDAGVPLIVSTLVSNLKDQPPFVSVNGVDETDPAHREWRVNFETGASLLEAGDFEAAVDAFQTAAAADPMHAETQFLLGRGLEAAGNHAAARAAYERARDLDGLRFRASADFNDVLRSVASVHGFPLVEMDSVFDRASGNGIPGSDLFWEHVHPRFDGYLLMARSFAAAMAEHGLGATRDEWQAARSIPDEEARALAGLTPFDEEVARVRIAYLMGRWPFRSVPEPFANRPQNRLQELVWEYLQGNTSWRLAQLDLAGAYEEQEDWPSAEKAYHALAVAFPQEPYYASAAGDMQARQGKVEQAAQSYLRALAYAETSDLHAKAGFAYFEMGRLDDAIRHLQRASNLEAVRREMPLPQRAHLDFVLAQAWLRMGRRDDAARQLVRLQQYAAEAPFTRALARELARNNVDN